MSDPTLLLGVAHTPEGIARAIGVLEAYAVEGKRALLEVPKEAVSWNAKKLDEYNEFFFVLDRYLKARGTHTIYGDSEEVGKLFDIEAEKILADTKKHFFRRLMFGGFSTTISEIEKRIETVSANTVDPYFLAQVKEHQPEFIILGDGHIRFLIREHYAKQNIPHVYERNYISP